MIAVSGGAAGVTKLAIGLLSAVLGVASLALGVWSGSLAFDVVPLQFGSAALAVVLAVWTNLTSQSHYPGMMLALGTALVQFLTGGDFLLLTGLLWYVWAR